MDVTPASRGTGLGMPSIDEMGDADSDADVAGSLDLTPRARPEAGSANRSPVRGRSLAVAAILCLLVVAGVVVVRSLGNATVFFYTADEALARRQDLAGRRFRLEGAVVPGTVQRTAGGVTFQVSNGGATVEVRHAGDPPEMFQPCIPVVLEGSWAEPQPERAAGAAPVYASDNIMVKHSEQYTEKNAERMQQAQQALAEGRCPAEVTGGSSKSP